jgi:hypothetical protein
LRALSMPVTLSEGDSEIGEPSVILSSYLRDG